MSRLPISFHTEILKRRMSSAELDTLLKVYNSAKLREGNRLYKPSATDIKCFDKYIAKKLTLEQAKDLMQVKHKTTVLSRFGHIAISRLSA